MTPAEITREFPYLREQDIRACLAYAADRERKLEISNASNIERFVQEKEESILGIRAKSQSGSLLVCRYFFFASLPLVPSTPKSHTK